MHDPDAEDDAHFRKTRVTTTARAHTHADFVAHAPLQHVVLSFTGIPDKHDLIKLQSGSARVCAVTSLSM